MHQWFISINGAQQGPYDQATAAMQARANPGAFCWRQGFQNWLPVGQVAELFQAAPAAPQGMMPSAPNAFGGQRADEVDYKIFGEDVQFVEIELDPGESCVAEAGSMMYKEQVVKMESVFGDGTQAAASGGFMNKLLGAGKRLITGESMFTTVFTHMGSSGKTRVAFAAPYPGTVLPLSLAKYGGKLICQKDAFLCAARGVSIGIHFQKKVLTALFGGEGFIMQKLEGDGMVFVHCGGTLVEKELRAGEVLHVDTGCVAAMTQTVSFDIEQVGGIKSMIFGGEGVFFAKMTGPGHVWIQSLPFSRLAGRIFAAAPQTGGGGVGEGSVLGGLGTLLGGDR
jgi:uncharacterized protein (TIGR00266 family)